MTTMQQAKIIRATAEAILNELINLGFSPGEVMAVGSLVLAGAAFNSVKPSADKSPDDTKRIMNDMTNRYYDAMVQNAPEEEKWTRA